MKRILSSLSMAGMTLIEVLIALAILSIAMMALLQSMVSDTRDIGYLRSKQAASWIALDAINQIKLGLILLDTQGYAQGQTSLLGQSLRWEAQAIATANKRIEKIHLTVSTPEKPKTLLLTWVSFLRPQP